MQIRAGHRNPDLIAGLSPIDTAIALHALDALAGRVDVPVELWPAMLFAPLLGLLVGAAAGDEGSAMQARKMLHALGETRGFSPLADALSRILDGDRNLSAAGEFDDPTIVAVIVIVLRHIEYVSSFAF